MVSNGNVYYAPSTVPARDADNNPVDFLVTADYIAWISGRGDTRFPDFALRLILPYIAQAWDALYPPKAVPGPLHYDKEGIGNTF